jgi:hypothetical protein
MYSAAHQRFKPARGHTNQPSGRIPLTTHVHGRHFWPRTEANPDTAFRPHAEAGPDDAFRPRPSAPTAAIPTTCHLPLPDSTWSPWSHRLILYAPTLRKCHIALALPHHASALPCASLCLPSLPPMHRATAPECPSTRAVGASSSRMDRLQHLVQQQCQEKSSPCPPCVPPPTSRLQPRTGRPMLLGPVRAPATSLTHPLMPMAAVQHHWCRFPSTPPSPRASTHTDCSGHRLITPACPRAPSWCPRALWPDHRRNPPPLQPADIESPLPDFAAMDSIVLVSSSTLIRPKSNPRAALSL